MGFQNEISRISNFHMRVCGVIFVPFSEKFTCNILHSVCNCPIFDGYPPCIFANYEKDSLFYIEIDLNIHLTLDAGPINTIPRITLPNKQNPKKMRKRIKEPSHFFS